MDDNVFHLEQKPAARPAGPPAPVEDPSERLSRTVDMLTEANLQLFANLAVLERALSRQAADIIAIRECMKTLISMMRREEPHAAPD